MKRARKKPKLLFEGPCFIQFLRSGESTATDRRSKGVWAMANDWKMWAVLKKQLKFPEEIIHTSLRPDIVLWLKGTKQAVLI